MSRSAASGTFAGSCHHHLSLVPEQSHPPKRRPPSHERVTPGPAPDAPQETAARSASSRWLCLCWAFPVRDSHSVWPLVPGVSHAASGSHGAGVRAPSLFTAQPCSTGWAATLIYAQWACFRSGPPPLGTQHMLVPRPVSQDPGAHHIPQLPQRSGHPGHRHDP